MAKGSFAAVVNQWNSKSNRRILEVKTMSQLGKRYKCQECNTEILCTKPGEGSPICCDKDMEVQEPKPLPSSD